MNKKSDLSISEVIDLLIEKSRTQVRIKNGNKVIGSSNVKVFKVLRNTLEKFVSERYKKPFSFYHFQDIDICFLTDYIIYLEKQAKDRGKGEKTTVPQRLKKFQAVFNHAYEMGLKNADSSIFRNVSERMKISEVAPPLILSADAMRKIEEMDRSFLDKREQFYLDLFLFSYYAGGISNIDMAYLTHNCIEDGIITYDKMNTNITVTIKVSSLAQTIIDRYQDESYSNYVLPFFLAKHKTDEQQRGRVERMGLNINRTLAKVCKQIKLRKKITLRSAQAAFIARMLEAGVSLEHIAQSTGHTFDYIRKHLK